MFDELSVGNTDRTKPVYCILSHNFRVVNKFVYLETSINAERVEGCLLCFGRIKWIGPDFFEMLPTSQVKKLARYCGLGQKRLG